MFKVLKPEFAAEFRALAIKRVKPDLTSGLYLAMVLDLFNPEVVGWFA